MHDEHVRLKRGELSRQWVTQRGRDKYCDVFGLFVRVLQRLQLSDVDYERVSSGGIQQCTPSACSSKFYSCPDPGAHNSALNENFATFYDCTCGCADTPSQTKDINRFYAGKSTMCTQNEKRESVYDV